MTAEPIAPPDVVSEAVAAADLVALRCTLAYLTSDLDLLDLDDTDLAAAAPSLIERTLADGGGPTDRAILSRIVATCAGTELEEPYVDYMAEQLDGPPPQPPLSTARPPFVIVIGAGMSGLCAATALDAAGIPFVVIEKNPDVGGTWFENTYPGCAVDTPSHLYDYSFAPNSDWPYFFSKRNDLLGYFQRCAGERGLTDRIRFGTEVRSVRFDEATGQWTAQVHTGDGQDETIQGDVVISAVGMLNRPRLPAIPGLSTFAGPAMHTARWTELPEAVAGRRVAVIGTGASALQLVPALAGQAAHVDVFQRTPHWMFPNPLYHAPITDGKRWLLEFLPTYQTWFRFRLFWLYGDFNYPALRRDPDWPHPERSVNAVNDKIRRLLVRHIEREIGDDVELLAKVVPQYPPFTKRMLIDNHWYRTLRRNDVDLVTEPIDRIVPGGVVTADGVTHPAGIIALATGFETTTMLAPLNISSSTAGALNDRWGDDPRAHLGITVPGYPNLFCLYGPNTNLGHGGSAFFQTECQMRYIIGCLRMMVERGWQTIDCRTEVHDAYNAWVDATHEQLVWTHPGTDNWFRNAAGRVTTNCPWRMIDYWQMTRTPDPADFLVR